MSDNFRIFMENVEVVGKEKAALLTPTGKVVKEFGFGTVKDVTISQDKKIIEVDDEGLARVIRIN